MLRPTRTGMSEVLVTTLWNEDDRPAPEQALSTGPTVDSHVLITNSRSGLRIKKIQRPNEKEKERKYYLM